MEIKRQKPIVEAYHFDMKNPKVEIEQKLNVAFAPLAAPDEDYPKENSILGARLEFNIEVQDFVISGAIGQINHIVNRKIENSDELTQEDADQLVEPLFDMLHRLTYEVTEIITDEPGIALQFNAQ